MSDDNLVAEIISKTLFLMREYPTQTKMRACFILIERILRLYAVCGSKETILSFVEELNTSLKESVEKYYKE